MGKLKVCVHILIYIYIDTQYIYIDTQYIYNIEYFKHVIYTWISMCGKKSPLPDSQRVCSGGGFADFAEVTGAFPATEG
jgi:histidyl-tRNA synthetase